ncbi:MAG: hypothetical protein ACLVAW_08865 [Eisenbergiella massiliensis]
MKDISFRNRLSGWKWSGSIPRKHFFPGKFSDLSLTIKMFLLFSCACLAAMGAAFAVSYRQLYASTEINQEFLASSVLSRPVPCWRSVWSGWKASQEWLSAMKT